MFYDSKFISTDMKTSVGIIIIFFFIYRIYFSLIVLFSAKLSFL